MKLIIGIDPGMTGAVAILHPIEGIFLHEMKSSADGKRVEFPPVMYDYPDGSSQVWETSENDPCWGGVHVFIEDINATPTFGSQTSFKMGRALGALETWASMIPGASIEYVKPLKWKKAFGLVLAKKLNANEAKRVSLECARRLFPQVDLHRVADHNKAEALLIAEYGRRVMG